MTAPERDAAGASHEPGADRTYYGRPVLKEPVWIWAVPVYFYVGGAAGAAAVLAEAVDSLGPHDARGLVARGRWIGAAGGALGTGLLVYDLGRPARFLNMLRVWRPTSPMSVGSWVLAAAAPAFALSAALPIAGARLGPRRGRALDALGDAAGWVSAALGLPLCAYTAVLLGNTAVPLWQAVRKSLPYLFVASAASSAAALLEMTDLRDSEAAVVRRFGTLAEVAELGAALVVERDAARVERVGVALQSGVAGALWRASTTATALGLALGLVPGRSRARSLAAGASATVSGIALRFAIFYAVKASARDPSAAFAQQKAGA